MLERVWRKGKLLHCWWECKLVQPLWRTIWRFLNKLHIELPYDPAILLLGICVEKNMIWKDTYTPMFLAAVHNSQGMCVCVCVCLRLVTQSCPTLCNHMDCSPPDSFVNGDSPGKNTGVGYHALLQGTFPTQGFNLGLPHCRQILYHLSHHGSPSQDMEAT